MDIEQLKQLCLLDDPKKEPWDYNMTGADLFQVSSQPLNAKQIICEVARQFLRKGDITTNWSWLFPNNYQGIVITNWSDWIQKKLNDYAIWCIPFEQTQVHLQYEEQKEIDIYKIYTTSEQGFILYFLWYLFQLNQIKTCFVQIQSSGDSRSCQFDLEQNKIYAVPYDSAVLQFFCPFWNFKTYGSFV